MKWQDRSPPVCTRSWIRKIGAQRGLTGSRPLWDERGACGRGRLWSQASGHTARARANSTRLDCGRGNALSGSEPRRVGARRSSGTTRFHAGSGMRCRRGTPSSRPPSTLDIAGDEGGFREVPTSAFAGLGRPEG